ncbi:MAG TPA: hypothetical protein VGC36_01360 [Rhizomicrobium sp.]
MSVVISQAALVLCIHVPTLDTSDASQTARNADCRNGDQADGAG